MQLEFLQVVPDGLELEAIRDLEAGQILVVNLGQRGGDQGVFLRVEIQTCR